MSTDAAETPRPRHLLKIGLPVLLGLVAGGLNFFALSLKDPVREYVQVSKEIPAGEPFYKSDTAPLEKLQVRAEIPSAVLWEDRSILKTLQANRAYYQGDVILKQDISLSQGLSLKENEYAITISLEGVKYEPSLLSVGKEIAFVVPVQMELADDVVDESSSVPHRILGPFRIVSIGADLDPTPVSASRKKRSTGTVTVASVVLSDGLLDDKTNRLIEANESEEISAVAVPR